MEGDIEIGKDDPLQHTTIVNNRHGYHHRIIMVHELLSIAPTVKVTADSKRVNVNKLVQITLECVLPP